MENIEVSRKAIVVGVNTGDNTLFNYQLSEIHNLCEGLNIEVLSDLVQNLVSINNATYIGKGKLEELNMAVSELHADMIIFNDELSPAQLKNITDYVDVEVMDRTMLILKIFEIRAKTKEAALQVEIANLNYLLPRLAGTYTNMSRIGGGASGGMGARRGSGETKLELDKRAINLRISKAKEELASITSVRKTNRKMRKNNNIKTVAFVGYTNAGKSSTINKLLELYGVTDKSVFVKDMLFATLETSTRSVKLPNNSEFLITDTVGFVSKLPHHLVESFKSTLEEITEADFIIHVVDASSPFLELQINTTMEVLHSLGVENIPMLYAFNKIDKVINKEFLPSNYQPCILLSSVDNTGYDLLINAIQETLFNDLSLINILLPYDKGDLFSILKENAEVLEAEYTNDGILIKVRVSPYLLAKCEPYILH